jgi:hypothetical protein
MLGCRGRLVPRNFKGLYPFIYLVFHGIMLASGMFGFKAYLTALFQLQAFLMTEQMSSWIEGICWDVVVTDFNVAISHK